MSRASGTPWWRRITLRDVVFFTAPPLLILTWWLGSAMLDYHRIRQFDDWWSNATSVRKFAWYRLRSLIRAPEMTDAEHRLSPEVEDKPVLRLVVDRNDWDRIDSDVAGRWGEWIKAAVADGNDLHDVELRWRGDGSVHWTTEKKSFTLKTDKKGLYKGYSSMAFSVKDVFPQWLVGSLASDFGLLAPETQLVPVYLNERFYGLHRFVEPVDESFLRHHVRLPGNIFRADTAERGDYFKGLPREVFMNPFIWDRVSMNDRPGAIGTRALGEFIADINDSTFEGHERLMKRLDRDELSRLLAYLLVVGDPYHMSGVHNQFWYEDPSSGTLHPIAWDVRLLDLQEPPHGANINRFWRAVLKDPRVWDGAMREVAKWLEGDKLYKLAEERANAVAERFKDELAYDNLRAGVIPPVGDAQSTLAVLRKNLDTLRERVDDRRTACRTGHIDERTCVVDLIARGTSAHEFTGFTFHKAPSEWWDGPPKIHVFADTDGNGQLDPTDRELAGKLDRLDSSDRPSPLSDAHDPQWHCDSWFSLLPGVSGTASALEPSPIAYRLFIAFNAATGDELEIEPMLRNPATKMLEDAEAWTSNAALPSTSSWHPWREGTEVGGQTKTFGFEELARDVVIEEGDTLVVRAGATLTLAPDVSLLIRGRAEFVGTKENPITIERGNPDRPWGVIALQGAGANGSRFEHVKFLGGGGALLDEVEYTGMVCVHNANKVVFDHCEFADNARCDDSLHVDRGEADVTNCWFHDGNSDSIDFDMSAGLIAHNKIENTANDGLDLMTCWPRIVDNDIEKCGDKGISVGEDSTPLVFNNRITGCTRGIEVKDRSRPLILDTSITKCGRGVYAHLKNWRYGDAGWPVLVRSMVAKNTNDYVDENDARRTLVGTLIGQPDPNAGDAPAPEVGDIEWLLRERGLEVEPASLGAVKSWKFVEPVRPLVLGTFEEDFVDPTDGWKWDVGVPHLVKRNGDLVASFARDRGRFGRTFDWNFADASREYALVLEIAGEGVTNVTATVASPAGDVELPIELDFEPKTYRFASVRLPARAYSGLMLTAEPTSARSHVYLHSYRVVAWPKSGGSK